MTDYSTTHDSSESRAQRLRAKAEEVRAAADLMNVLSARTTMHHIAGTYERIANQVEGVLKR